MGNQGKQRRVKDWGSARLTGTYSTQPKMDIATISTEARHPAEVAQQPGVTTQQLTTRDGNNKVSKRLIGE